MAQNKKEEFGIHEREVADFAKLLSHPARISILQTLAQRKSCVCGEIVEVLPLSQATVSQHLKELKLAGLITGEVEGNASCYCIDWANLERAKQNLDNLFIELFENKTTENCC